LLSRCSPWAYGSRRRHADVGEFWLRGTEAGCESDGEPGLRPQYSSDYYRDFLLDPDGNTAEVVCRSR